jgi:hypothetical protein
MMQRLAHAVALIADWDKHTRLLFFQLSQTRIASPGVSSTLDRLL